MIYFASSGIPLFPGTSEANQLECIANLLEKPPEEMLAKSTNFDKMKGMN